MLKRVDRIQVAVHDRVAAVAAYAALFSAEIVREDRLSCLDADRTVVQMGVSDVEFLQPTAAGAVQSHLDRCGEGLFAAGFATNNIAALSRHLSERGVEYIQERGQIHIEPARARGLRCVITQPGDREPAGNRVRYLYEVTFVVDDAAESADYYADLFGLDRTRFHDLGSELYGYTGILTLFDPPDRLDRIELTQITDASKPMGRFKTRRGGPCLYMCYLEAADPKAIIDACEQRGARWAPHRLNDDAAQPEGLYVHPSATHGVLIGVSRPDLAWLWSGDPARAAGDAS